MITKNDLIFRYLSVAFPRVLFRTFCLVFAASSLILNSFQAFGAYQVGDLVKIPSGHRAKITEIKGKTAVCDIYRGGDIIREVGYYLSQLKDAFEPNDEVDVPGPDHGLARGKIVTSHFAGKEEFLVEFSDGNSRRRAVVPLSDLVNGFMSRYSSLSGATQARGGFGPPPPPPWRGPRRAAPKLFPAGAWVKFQGPSGVDLRGRVESVSGDRVKISFMDSGESYLKEGRMQDLRTPFEVGEEVNVEERSDPSNRGKVIEILPDGRVEVVCVDIKSGRRLIKTFPVFLLGQYNGANTISVTKDKTSASTKSKTVLPLTSEAQSQASKRRPAPKRYSPGDWVKFPRSDGREFRGTVQSISDGIAKVRFLEGGENYEKEVRMQDLTPPYALGEEVLFPRKGVGVSPGRVSAFLPDGVVKIEFENKKSDRPGDMLIEQEELKAFNQENARDLLKKEAVALSFSTVVEVSDLQKALGSLNGYPEGCEEELAIPTSMLSLAKVQQMEEESSTHPDCDLNFRIAPGDLNSALNKDGKVETLEFGGGIKVGLAETIGNPARRRYSKLEDAHVAKWFSDSENNLRSKGIKNFGIAGIFDGHGGTDQVSKKAAELLPDLVRNFVGDLSAEQLRNPAIVSEKLQAVFARKEENYSPIQANHRGIEGRPNLVDHLHLFCIKQGNCPHGGSTAVVTVFINDDLYTVNLGDSRGVLVGPDGGAMRLSKDQTPDDEKKAITAAGGFVSYPEGVPRVDGNLACARSLGDFNLHVGRVPDVSHVNMKKVKPGAIILECDGVTEGMRKDSTVAQLMGDAFKTGRSVEGMAEDIVRKALRCGSTDNISALVLRMK